MKKLVLLGKSASGKDTLRDFFVSHKFKPLVSHTSRPIREGEIPGRSYHFLFPEYFIKLREENFFIEEESFTVFDGSIWHYGKSYEAVEKCDILIATVSGISNIIQKTSRDKYYIVELECPDHVRYERSLARGDNPIEVTRRIKADNIDFSKPRDFQVDIKLDTTNEKEVEEFKRRLLEDFAIAKALS